MKPAKCADGRQTDRLELACGKLLDGSWLSVAASRSLRVHAWHQRDPASSLLACDCAGDLQRIQQLKAPAQSLPAWCCCRIHDREAKYYADGEDAFDMRKYLKGKKASKHKSSTSGDAEATSPPTAGAAAKAAAK